MAAAYYRSGLLSHFPKVIRDLGFDPEILYIKSGFDQSQLQGPESLIPAARVEALFQSAQEETQCEHLGLLMGISVELTNLGPVMLMMQSAPTFGEAIEKNIKHLKTSMPSLCRELHKEGHTAFISNVFTIAELAQSKGAVQSSVAMLWRVCNLTTNNRWHPKQICFTFDKPQDSLQYRRIFQTPVTFNADFNGITFDCDDLALELTSRNALVEDVLQEYVSLLESNIPVNFLDSIKTLIRKQLDIGICSIDAVVEYLPYEKRALQRKLKDQNCSFQELLDEVRFEKASTHLKNSNISMSRLADALCYKNVSVFSKAFKNRFGVSPKYWQKNNRQ